MFRSATEANLGARHEDDVADDHHVHESEDVRHYPGANREHSMVTVREGQVPEEGEEERDDREDCDVVLNRRHHRRCGIRPCCHECLWILHEGDCVHEGPLDVHLRGPTHLSARLPRRPWGTHWGLGGVSFQVVSARSAECGIVIVLGTAFWTEQTNLDSIPAYLMILGFSI